MSPQYATARLVELVVAVWVSRGPNGPRRSGCRFWELRARWSRTRRSIQLHRAASLAASPRSTCGFRSLGSDQQRSGLSFSNSLDMSERQRLVVPVDASLVGPVQVAFEVNSVPLSLTMVAGRPRWRTTLSSSRATRNPDSEVSAARPRHSPGAVADHRQDAEAPPAGHLVGDEVQAPALVGHVRRLHRPGRADRPFARHGGATSDALRGRSSEPASC